MVIIHIVYRMFYGQLSMQSRGRSPTGELVVRGLRTLLEEEPFTGSPSNGRREYPPALPPLQGASSHEFILDALGRVQNCRWSCRLAKNSERFVKLIESTDTRRVAWFGGPPPPRAFDAADFLLKNQHGRPRGAPGVNRDRTRRAFLSAILERVSMLIFLSDHYRMASLFFPMIKSLEGRTNYG